MKSDKVYLFHIKDSIEKIQEFLEDVEYRKFLGDRLIQDGIVRELEIIGEASNRLSSKFIKNIKRFLGGIL